jgi:hypothetical protein
MRRGCNSCALATELRPPGRFLGDLIGRNRALSLTISLTALAALASGVPPRRA